MSNPAPAPIDIPLHLPYREAKLALLATFMDRYFGWHLKNESGNVSAVAKRIKLDRSNLRRLLKRHGDPRKAKTETDSVSPSA